MAMAVQHYYPQFYSQQDHLNNRTHNRGTGIYNDELETFLEDSYKIAQQVLRPEEQENYHRHCRYVGRVRCKSYVFAPIIVSAPTYDGGVVYGRRRYEEKPSNGLRFFAGVLGAICGGYAIFKIGQAVSTNREAGKELDEIHDFRGRIEGWKTNWRMLTQDREPDNQILSKVEKIADCRRNIFSRIKRKSQVDIVLLTGFIAAAILAIAGAIIGSYVMLAVSLALGLGTGAAMLLKWGLDSTTKGHTRDAKEIERYVRELWAVREREIVQVQHAPHDRVV